MTTESRRGGIANARPIDPCDRPNGDADNDGTSNSKKPNSGPPTLNVRQ
ncbi:MAG: hypothetical protein P8J27_08465 [Mariniblastus sp.]|nr:hypothetical protein [Mariniblastus sp.]